MRRLILVASAIVYLAPGPALAAEHKPSIHEFELGTDLSYVSASGYPSWTDGSIGKLRYDGSTDGLLVSRLFADYRVRAADTIYAHVVAQLYNDNFGPVVDLTEAYVEWRPLGGSRNRYRLKAGAFYPRVSLENTGGGWDNPYAISSSAINTWLAEEVRTVGVEASLSRRLQSFGGRHTVSLQAAAFQVNDPAGSLLAWKGWSVHDRQSRFGDHLPLPALPQLQPGMMFDKQDPYVAPFREVDNRIGYYVNVDWKIGNRLLMRAMHYDNHAEPTALESGQYAWRTDFNHIGMQLSLPANSGLIFQWMRGATEMGPATDGIHVVDADYKSHFILLTKAYEKQRITARYDRFDVQQKDNTPDDDNSESGHAWTIAYRYEVSGHVALSAEWLQIHTQRFAWTYFGYDPDKAERQYQLAVQLRFGNRH